MIFEDLLGDINAGDLLDVGCGTGQMIEIMVQALHSFDSITGIDVEGLALTEAGNNFPEERYRFIEASSQSQPFEKNSFDFVSISKALHHVEDERQTLSEMMRVLKPGGYMLINEMVRDGLSESQQSHMLYHHLRAEIDRLMGLSHKKTYYRSDLLEIIHSLGLKDLTLAEYQPQELAPKEPSNIAAFIEKTNGWLKEIAGHPQYEEFEPRIASLQARFEETGISRPTQIIALGIKP